MSIMERGYLVKCKERVPKIPSFHTLLKYWCLSRGMVRGVFHSGPSEFWFWFFASGLEVEVVD